MQIVFPTQVAQSIAVAYGSGNPPVLFLHERTVPSRIRGADGKPMPMIEPAGIEVVPFETAFRFVRDMIKAKRMPYDQRFFPEDQK